MMINSMSVSPDMPSSSPFQSQSLSTPTSSPPSTSLPLRTIPGSYGWPLLGPISDRLDYFWFQGPETFFRKRIQKHKSTVFRTNIPPTWPLFLNVNPNVIAVLDCKSLLISLIWRLWRRKIFLLVISCPVLSLQEAWGLVLILILLSLNMPRYESLIHHQLVSFR